MDRGLAESQSPDFQSASLSQVVFRYACSCLNYIMNLPAALERQTRIHNILLLTSSSFTALLHAAQVKNKLNYHPHSISHRTMNARQENKTSQIAQICILPQISRASERQCNLLQSASSSRAHKCISGHNIRNEAGVRTTTSILERFYTFYAEGYGHNIIIINVRIHSSKLAYIKKNRIYVDWRMAKIKSRLISERDLEQIRLVNPRR